MTIVIPGIFELLVTTFSRQYEILLRGEDTRDEWVIQYNALINAIVLELVNHNVCIC